MTEHWTDDDALFWGDTDQDVEKVRAELHDYRLLLHEVSVVYDHATGGRVTKPNTIASAVIGEIDAEWERQMERFYPHHRDHLVQFTEAGWMLMHPLEEREDFLLFDCEMNSTMESLEYHPEPGRYVLIVDDGVVTLVGLEGER